MGEEGATRLERVNGGGLMGGGGGDSAFQSIPRNDRFSLRDFRFGLTSCFGDSMTGVGGSDTASELLPKSGVPPPPSFAQDSIAVLSR